MPKLNSNLLLFLCFSMIVVCFVPYFVERLNQMKVWMIFALAMLGFSAFAAAFLSYVFDGESATERIFHPNVRLIELNEERSVQNHRKIPKIKSHFQMAFQNGTSFYNCDSDKIQNALEISQFEKLNILGSRLNQNNFYNPKVHKSVTQKTSNKPYSYSRTKNQQIICNPIIKQDTGLSMDDFFLYNLSTQNVKIIIPKLSFAIKKLCQEHEYKQNAIFLELRSLSNLIFGLKSDFSYMEKNILYKQITRIVSSIQQFGQDALKGFLQTVDNFSKKFKHNYKDLLKTLNTLTFNRFLEFDSKMDVLKFTLDYLNKQFIFHNPAKVKIVSRRCSSQPVSDNKPQQVYFIEEDDFCFVSQHQTNHSYNLQETILLAFIRSQNYRTNPNLLEKLISM